jgi:hypothetical protein
MRTTREHQQSVALLARQLERLKRVEIHSRAEWLNGKPCALLSAACADCGVIRVWRDGSVYRAAPSAFVSIHPRSGRCFIRSVKKSRLGKIEAKEILKMVLEIRGFVEAVEAWNRKQVPV